MSIYAELRDLREQLEEAQDLISEYEDKVHDLQVANIIYLDKLKEIYKLSDNIRDLSEE